MDIRSIEILATVAEAGSLSRAATMLALSQPTLSREIRLLESALGTRVLHRTGRGVHLTDDGRAFLHRVLPHARAILEAKADFVERARSQPTRIRLGWTGMIANPLGGRIVKAFTAAYPDVEMVTMGGSSTHIQQLLDAGMIDIGVFNSERKAHPHRQSHLLWAPLYFIAPPDGNAPAGNGEAIGLPEIADQPLYLHSRQHALRRAIDNAARKQGTSLTILAQTDEVLDLLALETDPRAGTILPLSLVPPSTRDKLVIRPIRPAIKIYYCMAYGPKAPTELSSALSAAIRQEIRLALGDGAMDGAV